MASPAAAFVAATYPTDSTFPTLTADHPALSLPSELNDYADAYSRRVVLTLPDGSRALPSTKHHAAISREQRAYIFAMDAAGFPRIADAVADCQVYALPYQQCSGPDHHFARAAYASCHDPFCQHCADGHSRLRIWARTRDLDRIRALPLTAVSVDLERPESDPWPSSRAACDEGWETVARFCRALRAYSVDAVVHAHPTESLTHSRWRIALAATDPAIPLPSMWQLRSLWRSACGLRTGTLTPPKPDSVLEWVFSGCAEAACLPGERRARLRITLHRRRLTFTTGEWFRTRTELEQAEHDAAVESAPCLCPKCRFYPMEPVPASERKLALCSAIAARYPYVEWSRSASVTHTYRNLRPDNSMRAYRDISLAWGQVGPPPPLQCSG